MRRLIIGQPFPNYQQQYVGPPAAPGLTPSPTSETTRPRLSAPFALENQLFPQQHLDSYRDDPSGSGPGGQEVNTPPPPPMNPLQRLWLALCPPPRTIPLPQGPWMMVLSDVPPEVRPDVAL